MWTAIQIQEGIYLSRPVSYPPVEHLTHEVPRLSLTPEVAETSQQGYITSASPQALICTMPDSVVIADAGRCFSGSIASLAA